MKKDILIGILAGILANALGIILYILLFSDKGSDATIEKALAEGYLGKIITLGATLNLITFFIFLKKNEIYKARGVLLATIGIAIITMLLMFY
ncbi:hypothetical protein [Dokdonia sp. Hel_I_53]|uniref:hypothetical protein n=1 Tax=Dokdonia sp. Hel_I_53 TaxID=1566287 RepID=UPI001199F0CF|nr:hypothetical protein [Dokdonia sp. Hel_I_53]TVZ53112.1 hypothetical protein OD90_2305 [Dokdonia sp. Hel_I_53]